MIESILFYRGLIFWAVILIGIVFYYIIRNDKENYFESESDYFKSINKMDIYHNKVVYAKLSKKKSAVYDKEFETELIDLR